MSNVRYYTPRVIGQLTRCTVRLLAAIVTGNGTAMENVFDDVNAIHAEAAR